MAASSSATARSSWAGSSRLTPRHPPLTEAPEHFPHSGRPRACRNTRPTAALTLGGGCDGPTALSDRTWTRDSGRRGLVADLVADRARAAPRRYRVPARRRHVLFSSGDLDHYQHRTQRAVMAV